MPRSSRSQGGERVGSARAGGDPASREVGKKKKVKRNFFGYMSVCGHLVGFNCEKCARCGVPAKRLGGVQPGTKSGGGAKQQPARPYSSRSSRDAEGAPTGRGRPQQRSGGKAASSASHRSSELAPHGHQPHGAGAHHSSAGAGLSNSNSSGGGPSSATHRSSTSLPPAPGAHRRPYQRSRAASSSEAAAAEADSDDDEEEDEEEEDDEGGVPAVAAAVTGAAAEGKAIPLRVAVKDATKEGAHVYMHSVSRVKAALQAPVYAPLSPLDAFSAGQIEAHVRALQAETFQRQFRPLLHRIMESPLNGGTYNAPVQPSELGIPDYFEVIRQPMDLGTVRQKLESGRYKQQEEFLADAMLVFANAMRYNPPGHSVHAAAARLSEDFLNDYNRLTARQEVDSRRKDAHSCGFCQGQMCKLCGDKCLRFDPPVISCDCCLEKVRRGDSYYRAPSGQRWCTKCVNNGGVNAEPGAVLPPSVLLARAAAGGGASAAPSLLTDAAAVDAGAAPRLQPLASVGSSSSSSFTGGPASSSSPTGSSPAAASSPTAFSSASPSPGAVHTRALATAAGLPHPSSATAFPGPAGTGTSGPALRSLAASPTSSLAMLTCSVSFSALPLHGGRPIPAAPPTSSSGRAASPPLFAAAPSSSRRASSAAPATAASAAAGSRDSRRRSQSASEEGGEATPGEDVVMEAPPAASPLASASSAAAVPAPAPTAPDTIALLASLVAAKGEDLRAQLVGLLSNPMGLHTLRQLGLPVEQLQMLAGMPPAPIAPAPAAHTRGSKVRGSTVAPASGASRRGAAAAAAEYPSNGPSQARSLQAIVAAAMRSKLERRCNDDIVAEPWVQCDRCHGWVHQVCAMFNARKNALLPFNAEYVCPICRLDDLRKAKGDAGAAAAAAAAGDPSGSGGYGTRSSSGRHGGVSKAASAGGRGRAPSIGGPLSAAPMLLPPPLTALAMPAAGGPDPVAVRTRAASYSAPSAASPALTAAAPLPVYYSTAAAHAQHAAYLSSLTGGGPVAGVAAHTRAGDAAAAAVASGSVGPQRASAVSTAASTATAAGVRYEGASAMSSATNLGVGSADGGGQQRAGAQPAGLAYSSSSSLLSSAAPLFAPPPSAHSEAVWDRGAAEGGGSRHPSSSAPPSGALGAGGGAAAPLPSPSPSLPSVMSACADPYAAASPLPHTPLSLELERRVRDRMQSFSSSPDIAASVVVRVVSSLRKTIRVPAEVRAVFTAHPPNASALVETLACTDAVSSTALESVAGHHGSPPRAAGAQAEGRGGGLAPSSSSSSASSSLTYASEYSYRQRVILLWQRLDGVDVCLFALYVQEYGADCPPPNTRKIYIAYLDSVRYLRPLTARTAIYHELLTAYLTNARQRGYASAYIWACPPQRSDTGYIFHSHPPSQRVPGKERLREWYDEMLAQLADEGLVAGISSIFDEHFEAVTAHGGGAAAAAGAGAAFSGMDVDLFASQAPVPLASAPAAVGSKRSPDTAGLRGEGTHAAAAASSPPSAGAKRLRGGSGTTPASSPAPPAAGQRASGSPPSLALPSAHRHSSPPSSSSAAAAAAAPELPQAPAPLPSAGAAGAPLPGPPRRKKKDPRVRNGPSNRRTFGVHPAARAAVAAASSSSSSSLTLVPRLLGSHGGGPTVPDTPSGGGVLQVRLRADAGLPPYFAGDFWAMEMERMIRDLHKRMLSKAGLLSGGSRAAGKALGAGAAGGSSSSSSFSAAAAGGGRPGAVTSPGGSGAASRAVGFVSSIYTGIRSLIGGGAAATPAGQHPPVSAHGSGGSGKPASSAASSSRRAPSPAAATTAVRGSNGASLVLRTGGRKSPRDEAAAPAPSSSAPKHGSRAASSSSAAAVPSATASASTAAPQPPRARAALSAAETGSALRAYIAAHPMMVSQSSIRIGDVTLPAHPVGTLGLRLRDMRREIIVVKLRSPKGQGQQAPPSGAAARLRGGAVVHGALGAGNGPRAPGIASDSTLSDVNEEDTEGEDAVSDGDEMSAYESARSRHKAAAGAAGRSGAASATGSRRPTLQPQPQQGECSSCGGGLASPSAAAEGASPLASSRGSLMSGGAGAVGFALGTAAGGGCPSCSGTAAAAASGAPAPRASVSFRAPAAGGAKGSSSSSSRGLLARHAGGGAAASASAASDEGLETDTATDISTAPISAAARATDAADAESDERISCDFFDTRHGFLRMCQGNNYQFDTLRRAKHSSMMILWHLHHPAIPAYAHFCNQCEGDIGCTTRWHCASCDYDICESCHESSTGAHPHPHALIPLRDAPIVVPAPGQQQPQGSGGAPRPSSSSSSGSSLLLTDVTASSAAAAFGAASGGASGAPGAFPVTPAAAAAAAAAGVKLGSLGGAAASLQHSLRRGSHRPSSHHMEIDM